MQDSLTKSRRRRVVRIFISAFLISAFLRLYIYIPTDVTGISMYPTLYSDDHVVMTTVSNIDRFDIVIFNDPMNKTVVKRVIGMPGDTIRYEQDQLFINDELVKEPFLNHSEIADEPGLWTSNFTMEGINGNTVPEGHYFLMGDNRRYSYDSRFYGSIPTEEIIGEIIILYYPFERINLF